MSSTQLQPITNILEVLQKEREYQRRRWGCRQPNGQLVENSRPISAFVLFMQHYYAEARHQLLVGTDISASLDSLRKLVALGIACWEQHGPDNQGCTFESVADAIVRGVPVVPKSNYYDYLLAIGGILSRAAANVMLKHEAQAEEDVRLLVQYGIECFSDNGIIPRNFIQGVPNRRDGLPT